MKSTTKEIKNMSVYKQTMLSKETKYYVLNQGNKSIKNVSSVVFAGVVAPTMSVDGYLLKYKGATRQEAKNLFCKFLSAWKGQGIWEKLSNFSHAMDVFSEAMALYESGKEKVLSFPWSQVWNEVLELIFSSMYLFQYKDWASILGFGFRVWQFTQRALPAVNLWRGQGLPEMALTMMSFALPNEFIAVIKRMQLFTNEKAFDDPSSFQTFANWVLDLFAKAFELCGEIMPAWMKESCESSLHFLGKFSIVREIGLVLADFKKNPQIVVNPTFVSKVKQLNSRIEKSPGFAEYARKSSFVKAVYESYSQLLKSILARESVSRVEPCCFVFEGPPGCFKSGIVNQLITVLGEPFYTHMVPTSTEGKDFYDTYAGEPLFCMDDVGQKGVDQFRTLINMVSSMKMPLQCASAQLKDTKFFVSDTILLTTNCFTQLNGLTKSDGIANIHALWRRGFVFDLSGAVRVDSKLKGRISFKTYDLKSKGFVEGFEKDVNMALVTLYGGVHPYFDCDGETDEPYLSWMYKIIQAHRDVRKSYKTRALLDNEKVGRIRSMYKPFKPNCATDTEYESEEDIVVKNKFERTLISDSESLVSEDYSYFDPLFEPPVLVEHVENNDFYLYDEEIQAIVNPLYEYGKQHEINKEWCLEDALLSPSRTWYRVLNDYVLETFAGFKSGLKAWFSSWTEGDFVQLLKYTVPLVLCVGVTTAANLWKATQKEETDNFVPNSKEEELLRKINSMSVLKESKIHSLAAKVASQNLPVRIKTSSGREMRCAGTVSGHSVVVPAHAVGLDKEGFMTVGHSKGVGRCLDNVKYKVVYLNHFEDVAICRFPGNISSFWSNLSHAFRYTELMKNPVVCFQGMCVEAPQTVKKIPDRPICYKMGNIGYEFEESNVHQYDLEGEGLCGALLMTQEGVVHGMHIAGNEDVKIGAASLWSYATLMAIRLHLQEDKGLSCDIPIKCPIGESGFKLDVKAFETTPKKSNIVPSPLYGALPVTRYPADLVKYGNHTVKSVALKSFEATSDVDWKALEFAKEGVATLLAPFGVLAEREVVLGNDFLAAMNKESSNGYMCEKDKAVYVNFEKGEITDRFRQELADMESEIVADKFDYKKWAWKECTKDELRNSEKDGVPRTFRISRVHTQYLMKKYFGNFVGHMMQNRSRTQIMIGVNPFVEWDAIYDNLVRCSGVWAGDIKTFDGKMLPQGQDGVAEVIMRFFLGTEAERKVAEFLLRDMQCTTVVLNDDVWRTTHSMPSGSFLTAMMNSMMNRLYTLMWYYHNVPNPSLLEFNAEVIDYVYGDDKLNGLRSNKLRHYLNAITMAEFFESIGMGFTTASKTKIVEPFEDLSEVSFLKRYFRLHGRIGRVMCPLDMRTLDSGLSWVDSTKDTAQVLQDKLETYQREMYLHYDGVEKIEKVKKECLSKGVYWPELTESYMHYVYVREPHVLKAFSWGGSKYT